MVSILEELASITNGRAEYVVQGADIHELMAAETSTAVLEKAAAAGLNRPGISNAGGPYPVDADGQTDDDLLLGKRPIAGYRRDFIVLASI